MLMSSSDKLALFNSISGALKWRHLTRGDKGLKWFAFDDSVIVATEFGNGLSQIKSLNLTTGAVLWESFVESVKVNHVSAHLKDAYYVLGTKLCRIKQSSGAVNWCSDKT
jgi:hypothetical protein